MPLLTETSLSWNIPNATKMMDRLRREKPIYFKVFIMNFDSINVVEKYKYLENNYLMFY